MSSSYDDAPSDTRAQRLVQERQERLEAVLDERMGDDDDEDEEEDEEDADTEPDDSQDTTIEVDGEDLTAEDVRAMQDDLEKSEPAEPDEEQEVDDEPDEANEPQPVDAAEKYGGL